MTVNTIQPNIKQLECITNINGRFLVLAGPGTGKTTTIINRIEYMLNQNILPEKILCLTFTEAAANEMSKRLERKLNKLSSGVNIYTYHSFCYDIIENFPEDFELPQNISIITPSISRALIKECIEEIKPKAYRTERNDPYYFIDIIKYGIEEIKRNRLNKQTYFQNIKTNPDWEPELNKLKQLLDEKNKKGDTRTITLIGNIKTLNTKIEKAYELWKFYELYTDKMLKNNYIDFNDMINMVLNKFDTHPEFLEKIANQYEYLLVDEYQDTNKNQNEIVISLSKTIKTQNIFVVGDDDQIIYTFQGARLDTIEKFLKEFSDTNVICLTENHRSTQQILDVARELTKMDSKRLEDNPEFAKYNINKQLTAMNTKLPPNKVRCYKYAEIMQEYNEIVKEIDELIHSENCPKDQMGNNNLAEIAILARTNAELETFAQMLKERNIPSELKDGKSIFTIKSSIIMFYYMQFLANPELNSDKLFKYILAKPFNINAKDYTTIYNEKSKNKSIIETIKQIDKTNFVEPAKIERFIKTFDYLYIYKTNESLKNVVLEIGAKTGIFDYYLNSDINKTENIAGIKKLIDEAEGFSKVYKTIGLEDFIEYLSISLNDGIEIKTDKAPVSLNAIQLLTYYSAKGREFEYVYMPTLIDRNWEADSKSFKSKIPLSEYKTEDELKAEKLSDRIKVMYVGMTRAKHSLRLSYIQYGNGKAKNPSMLIANIQDKFEKESEPFEYNIESYWNEVSSSIIKRDYNYKKDFTMLINNILENKNYSPTSINKYLKCPRQYLYDDILNLDSITRNADALNFGTAIHDACEFGVNEAINNRQYPTKDQFINKFKQKLSALPLSNYNQRLLLEQRGVQALEKYHSQLCLTPIDNLVQAEKNIAIEIDGIRFKGKIDRIDKNEDGTYNLYDYKTGNAKSKRSICPGGEHEDYYNQLGFYKFLFEKESKNTIKETSFIFPEEYTKNLTIEYTQQDCEKIFAQYKQAVIDIRDHKFEPTYNENVCKWCQYKDFCNLEII